MTILSRAHTVPLTGGPVGVEMTPAKHHPHRWRLHRAGVVNVWYYYDTEFEFSGGRMVLRGTNGSGKSRALEMLLPFLLDADRRKMDATGSGRVRLEDLMRVGGDDQQNRLGYLWLELMRHGDDTTVTQGGAAQREHITLGALIRFSRSAGEAKAWYFTTPNRVGHDLHLLSEDRVPLSRDDLASLIGADRITDSPEIHRERVRTAIFGLPGDSGKDRFAGLLQLLRTLRSPDVGNRIDEGKLPQILSDALPPPSEAALGRAGERLDELSETRDAQQRLETAHRVVAAFLDTYRRYAAGVLSETAKATQATAVAVTEAEREADEARDIHLRLTEEHSLTEARVGELAATEDELSRTVEGIRGSKEYGDARDLEDREQTVRALERAAELAIQAANTAGDNEHAKVRKADECAAEAVEATGDAVAGMAEARDCLSRAGLHASLPHVDCVRIDQPGSVEVSRPTLHSDPEPVTRPAPVRLEVTPEDLSGTVEQVKSVAQAARQRNVHAAARLDQAQRLDKQALRVRTADDRASEAEQRLADLLQEVAEKEQARDEAGLALARSWRAWLDAEATRELLSDVDWRRTALRAVLENADVLTGGDSADLLTELEDVAARASSPVHDEISRELYLLDIAQETEDKERRELMAERTGLLAAHDPDPPAPHWTRVPSEGEVPLWRAVDFASHLDAPQRAGLEAALLASGLLTATITTDGALIASDGQLLLRPTGPMATCSLNEALTPDPTSRLSAEQVRGVLSRIALNDRSHPTWVDTDGAWGNGPLAGRHRATTARHIGAATRAAARAARIAEIDESLAMLTASAEARVVQQSALLGKRQELDALVRSAPRGHAVRTAEVLVTAGERQAKKAEAEARKERGAAVRLRREWTEALAAHRDACADFGLPDSAEELAAARHALQESLHLCESSVRYLTEARRRIRTHVTAVAECEAARLKRREAEETAETQWVTWQGEAAELAALSSSIGVEAETVRKELRAAETELTACRRDLKEMRTRASGLAERKGTAEAEARIARDTATQTRRLLIEAAGKLTTRLGLPGLAASATGQPRFQLTITESDPASVEAGVAEVLAAIGRDGRLADENVLIRAQQNAERELSGELDVISTVQDGVRLMAIADANGRRSLPEAAADLEHRRTKGKKALTERERNIFTEFVVGGVAEELRQRLRQAEALIKAMNTTLADIRTSHGIGVRLRWSLAEGVDADVTRIRELIAIADDVRAPDLTEELTDLLKTRVERRFATDPTAGYADHLKSALDYRAWHEVVVFITGPEPGQERKISRRAKLSQGETRFVSYVTLFGAADAYLSGLPDTSRALRLILLDDAFAKVDDPTIGELMGLLVRLDLDFAMTGHALWGFYEQVPALDCYEIRRGEGTAAVTTHMHWDGHNRHLRAAR
ncbi:TIGR02680 family protein [Sphaerisporangium rubeum]|uniref:Uncharacterized protein (TIGR02680 family) n=1 Tax=Sphaerisporangium rubeum TaxID=321317 RepID=A0A7X0I9M3_9ACTN|nr:TIGR02680 family protein [Sphaerisporangium rubeum]MBB6471187.1 uncharacterized protein (TIGR02680 family) [Sphaerisporangium rubeum]